MFAEQKKIHNYTATVISVTLQICSGSPHLAVAARAQPAEDTWNLRRSVRSGDGETPGRAVGTRKAVRVWGGRREGGERDMRR